MTPVDRALSTLGIRAARSTKDLTMPSLAREPMPADPDQYELLDDCGRGVSATVHRALCKPLHEIVAVKKLNLDSMNCNLEEIIAEAQTMKSYNHPNVLPLYTSFVTNQDLYMITPFMTGGSILHIMKYAYPEGLEEPVIATIMRDVLKGLEYVHKNGGIHRDVKAGNILIDKDGTVKIGDFGVSATIERGGSWGNDKVTRTTFVGTPCWMAPEVMEQTQGYDSSADIWSFGITMLELANGHAPFAKFPPMKVLLMTLQNPPPQLDDQSGRKHFSKHMRDVVTRCLQKDPTKRPTATQLLEHRFFKQAKDEEYVRSHVLAGLPPLSERVQQIRAGVAATNAADNDRRLERSQEEYVKGVSAWNFDLAALKAQAALEPDDGSVPPTPTFHPSMPTILEGPEDSGRLDAGVPSSEVAAITAALERNSAGSASVSRRSTTDEGPSGAVLDGAGGSRPATPGPPGQEEAAVSSSSSGPVTASGDASGALIAAPAAGGLVPVGPTQLAPVATSSSSSGAMPPPPRRTVSAFAGSNPSAAAAATLAAAGGTGVHMGLPPHAPSTSAAASDPNALQAFHSEPMPGAAAAVAGSSSNSHATVPMWSPPSNSPAMSRESSSQGPLSALATPTAAVAKQKKHGRFQVYEAGDVPPPMSPPANRQLSEQSSAGPMFARDAPPLSGPPSEHRTSETGDGTHPTAPKPPTSAADNDALVAAAGAVVAAAAASSKPQLVPMLSTHGLPPSGASADKLLAAADSMSIDSGSNAIEPKKRGRFKIIEEEGPSRGTLSKVSSSADLRQRADGTFRPVSSSGGGLLPRLQELADQAAAHQAAIMKLVESVTRDGALVAPSAAGATSGVSSPVGVGPANGAATASTSTGGATAAAATGATATGRNGSGVPSTSTTAAPTPAPSTSGVAGAVQSLVDGAVAARNRAVAGPSSLSRTTSSGGGQRPGGGSSDIARRSVAAMLEKGEGAVDVAERLQERVLELERKVAELQDENGRLKMRSHELSYTIPSSIGEPSDSAASSRNTSRRTSAANFGATGGAPSNANSMLPSPLLSPRQELTPQASVDGGTG